MRIYNFFSTAIQNKEIIDMIPRNTEDYVTTKKLRAATNLSRPAFNARLMRMEELKMIRRIKSSGLVFATDYLNYFRKVMGNTDRAFTEKGW